MDAVQEIKSRLNIEDIVAEYVQLKRAGRNYKGLSPFTNEKSPSFIVSPEKQIWHDFSSGKGGDVISFIQEVEGVDFKAALELLARKAGVDISVFQKGKPSDTKVRDRLFLAIETAVSYYQQQLLKHDMPLRYVREKRGYEKQTLLDFRFGYSPQGSTNLVKFLQEKGFREEELIKAGLAVKRDSGVIDMFRNRLMIPLSDTQGRPVGFTARQLDNDKNAPKYINTPATILYDKSRQLFGFSQAKEHIRKNGYVVVVEGNLDVVASHQAGVKQVVASAGTALTPAHLKSLQRFTGDVRLAFDDDRAGQEAAQRTIPLAQSLGIELSFIKIPSGKDPDELIAKDVKLWQEIVSSPEYMIDWLLARVGSVVDLSAATGKRQFTSQVLDIVRQIHDEVEQEHYLRIIADMTNTSIESVTKKFEHPGNERLVRLKKVQKTNPENKSYLSDKQVLEQHFLSIMLAVPSLRNKLEHIPKDLYSEQSLQLLDESDMLQEVKKSSDYVKMLTLLFEETYQHTDADELSYQVGQLVRRLIDNYTRNKKSEILDQLSEADEQTEKKLLTKVNELEKLKKQFRV